MRILLCFALTVLLNPQWVRAADRPNIVVVLLDNIGQDWFGCYGSVEGKTPHIDALARSGVRFPNCYVMPLCSTSRHVFLTGRYPFRTGWTVHHDAAIYGGGYFDWKREISFGRVLKQAGYATAVTGKWQVNNLFDQPDALARHGFDEHCVFPEGPKGHPAHIQRYWDPYVLVNGKKIDAKGKFGPDLYTDHLIDFIERHRDGPFLAFYSAVFAHMPVTTTPLQRNDKLPEKEMLGGMMHYADHCVGRIVKALDELGIRENTVVIVTTDNGTPKHVGGAVKGRIFRAAAETMTEGAMREGSINVPFIVNWPAVIKKGRVTNALTDASDLFPTLVDLAGAKLPDDRIIDGRSLVPVFKDESKAAAHRAWIHSQYHTRHVVSDGRYKYHSDGQLYDLKNDPLEEKNLIKSTDPAEKAARARLQKVVQSFPPNAKSWFTPRSISARRLGIGTDAQRAADAKAAPDSIKSKKGEP